MKPEQTTKPLAPSAVQQQRVILNVGKETATQRIAIQRDQVGHWIPVGPVMKSLGMNVVKSADGKSVQIGQTDVMYVLRQDQARAEVMGSPVQLPQAPKRIGSELYLSEPSLESLLGTRVTFDRNRNVLDLKPLNDLHSGIRQADISGGPNGLRLMSMLGGSPIPLPTSTPRQARATMLVKTANQYMGTPYQFGAKPYPVSGTFDCSSFVQYVYAKAGVSLPRASRTQAQVGKEVQVSQLRTGDLLFFYTPGRFSSNKIVGHVGMYAGNGMFIHTYGKPGVTKNKIDDPKWSYRLLFAKRIS